MIVKLRLSVLNNLALKPMDSEEAVLQMELLGHDFYIFTIVKQMVQVLFINVKTVNMD